MYICYTFTAQHPYRHVTSPNPWELAEKEFTDADREKAVKIIMDKHKVGKLIGSEIKTYRHYECVKDSLITTKVISLEDPKLPASQEKTSYTKKDIDTMKKCYDKIKTTVF